MQFLKALNRTDYKKEEAARILGITFDEFLNKIVDLDITKEIKPRDIFLAIKEDYRDQLNRNSLDKYLEMIEGNAILTALGMTTHKYDAAEILGISFRTFRYRIDKLGIDESRPSSISTTVKSDYFKHSRRMSLEEFLNTIEKIVIEMALEENQNQKKSIHSNPLKIIVKSLLCNI